MHLARYALDGARGVAAARADGVFHGLILGDPACPGDVDSLLGQGPEALAAAAEVLAGGQAIDLTRAEFLPPLARPGKILCVGLNYADHSAEFAAPAPDHPVVFARFPSTLIGHDQAIVRPRVSDQLDYEGEFVAVIGRRGRHIARAAALDHVAAYALFNDVSVRDYQMRTSQWTVGKNFDRSGPFGPWLVTADALPPGCRGLRLQTRLNGVVVQDASTNDMLFDVATLVATLSEAMTLEPGDMIVTGTPAGVGGARTPPLWMRPGDVVEVELEGLGVLRNVVRDE
ncbi:fumarylacetoacetate hydrolase family protein [Zavarzinia sp. CC-PAN008]|uniref:fumarylacetoacetate hydrolase family protein n=1 Tax=Zavarzinia sp. CC-PAN008 TaxID=3243332 RepID=UPI003F7475A2